MSSSPSSSSSSASSPTTRRLTINASIFNASPVRTIKQLIGPNSLLISYKINTLITPYDEVIVDVVYKDLPLSPFAIYYIPTSSIKHLIPNSEKYVATINDIPVKLNNPKLNDFKDYLPVHVKNTIINDTTAYEQYYSSLDSTTYTLSTPTTTPHNEISYFATTVTNPLNSLLTPLSLLTSSASTASFGFSTTTPPILYPETFKPPPSPYDQASTIRYYQQTISTIPSLSLITTITPTNTFPHETAITTTAYLLDASLLPDTPIRGIILLQPKRPPTQLLFYPTSSYIISSDEIASIKSFIKSEVINYNNFHYLKHD